MSSPVSKPLTLVGRARPERVIHKRSAEERARVLARFERSGQPPRRFCRDNGLPLSTLRYWLRQDDGHASTVVGVAIPEPD